MRKAKKTLLALLFGATAAISSGDEGLHEKVEQYLDSENLPRREYLLKREFSQILGEGDIPVSMINEAYSLDTDLLILTYAVSPLGFRDDGITYHDIGTKPSFYLFRGKYYEDPEHDGINGNEVPLKTEGGRDRADENSVPSLSSGRRINYHQ